MKNYKFNLLIKPEEIYNNLFPEQKNQFDNIQITKATLLNSGDVEIECLALNNNVVETSCRQILSFSSDKYISAWDI